MKNIFNQAKAMAGGRQIFFLILAFAFPATSASALDPRIAKSLSRLDPDTRLEQVCDLEAMARIKRETKFSPDRAKSDVVVHPLHQGDMMQATGAAFRSRGSWYRFSFSCKGTPDHLGVVTFSYELGGLIPESKWAEYGLWH